MKTLARYLTHMTKEAGRYKPITNTRKRRRGTRYQPYSPKLPAWKVEEASKKTRDPNYYDPNTPAGTARQTGEARSADLARQQYNAAQSDEAFRGRQKRYADFLGALGQPDPTEPNYAPMGAGGEESVAFSAANPGAMGQWGAGGKKYYSRATMNPTSSEVYKAQLSKQPWAKTRPDLVAEKVKAYEGALGKYRAAYNKPAVAAKPASTGILEAGPAPAAAPAAMPKFNRAYFKKMMQNPAARKFVTTGTGGGNYGNYSRAEMDRARKQWGKWSPKKQRYARKHYMPGKSQVATAR